MVYTEVKDSGAREEFPTGSQRDLSTGKGRYDLIPPYSLKRLAVHYENGAKKYGDRNWEKGQPLWRYFNSAVGHLFAWMAGLRDEDHLAAAAWNIFSLIHTEEEIKAGRLPQSLMENLPESWSNDTDNNKEATTEAIQVQWTPWPPSHIRIGRHWERLVTEPGTYVSPPLE